MIGMTMRYRRRLAMLLVLLLVLTSFSTLAETELLMEPKIEPEVETDEDTESGVQEEELSGKQLPISEPEGEKQSVTESTYQPQPQPKLQPQPVRLLTVTQATYGFKLEDVQASLDKVIGYYALEKNATLKPNPPTKLWRLIGLWGAGINLHEFNWINTKDDSPIHPDSKWQQGVEGKITKGSEYADYIIGSILLGKDPRKFGRESIQRDLLTELKEQQNEDGAFLYQNDLPIDDHALAMIALDVAGGEYDREKAVQFLLRYQAQNGYFKERVRFVDGNLTSTSLALVALSFNTELTGVSEIMDEIKEEIKQELLTTTQPIFLARGLSAYVLYGEELLGEEFRRDGEHLLEYWISNFQNEAGYFSVASNPFATQYSLLALGDIVAGKSAFQRLKEYRENKEQEAEKGMTIRVEGRTGSLLEKTKLDISATDIRDILSFLTEMQLASTLVFNEDVERFVLTKLGGEEQVAYPSLEGWHYLINGQPTFATVGEAEITQDAEIYFYYGNVSDVYLGNPHADAPEKLTLLPKITLSSSQPIAGQDLQIVITATYDIYDPFLRKVAEDQEYNIEGVTVLFNDKEYISDEEGVATIPGAAVKPGSHLLKISKEIKGSYPRLVRMEEIIEVGK